MRARRLAGGRGLDGCGAWSRPSQFDIRMFQCQVWRGRWVAVTLVGMESTTAARNALKAWESVVGAAQLEPGPLVTNPTWCVASEDGRRFVLKQLPEYPTGVGPVEQFRVLYYLQRAGIPIAPPIVTDDGSIHTPVEGRSYALLPFVPNDRTNHELEPTAAATAFAIGTAIGQLDKTLADCPWRVHSYVDEPAPEILGKALPKLPAEITQPLGPFVDRLWAAVSKLPTQRTVGDCNAGNVLVRDNQVSAFIDLDHLPIGPRVWDLSDYLASRLRTHLSQRDTAERDTAAMLAVIPLILVITIGLADWHLNGWVPDPDGYQQSVRAITWITVNLGALTTAAATPPMPNAKRP